MEYQNIDEIDREIMRMRALGYHQDQIAIILGMSQSTISLRIEKIRKLSEGNPDREKLFWTLILGAGAIYILGKMFDKK